MCFTHGSRPFSMAAYCCFEVTRLKTRYVKLKDEVKEAEQIRKSVYSILRQEQREQQPHRPQDVEL